MEYDEAASIELANTLEEKLRKSMADYMMDTIDLDEPATIEFLTGNLTATTRLLASTIVSAAVVLADAANGTATDIAERIKMDAYVNLDGLIADVFENSDVTNFQSLLTN